MKSLTHILRVACCAAALLAGSAALGASFEPKTEPATPSKPVSKAASDAVYDLEHLLEVELTLSPEDWRTLRMQHRNLMGGSARDRSSAVYTPFKASLKIDGQEIRSVGVRKKGLLGSVVSTRPSLRISFDEFTHGQRFAGLSSLTLNNNNQDPSQICQWFTYQLFRSAGQPAPRCNFARVKVNGENLGIYSNVEPLNNAFLKRQFGSAAGNLYEGGGDFLPGAVDGFEKKNKRSQPDRSDLRRVVSVLENTSSNLAEALDQVVDLDAFLTFWALEVLVGHWDSYSSSANNFAVYHHPRDGKFRFIPWGADDVFRDPGPFLTRPVPHSVKAGSALPRRLYADPELRDRYRARMQQLLDTVWDEPKLLASIDQAVRVIRGAVLIPPEVFRESIARNQQFIQARRGQIEAELRAQAPLWPEHAKPARGGPRGFTRATFATTWTDLVPNPVEAAGQLTMEMQFEGKQVRLTKLAACAGLDPKSVRPDHPLLLLGGWDEENNRYLVAWFAIDPFAFKDGRALAVNFFEVFGLLAEVSAEQMQRPDPFQEPTLLGWLGGSLRLDKASRTAGSPITGKVEAAVF